MFRPFYILFILLHLGLLSFSQGWSGFQTGLYSGISSANARPGGMAATPYKVDATVLGINLYTQTENLFKNKDAVGTIFSGGFKGLAGISKLKDNNSLIFSNIQGPSALVGINPRLSVAFAWNMRFLWTSTTTDPKLSGIFDNSTGSVNRDGSGETNVSALNAWNEFGIGAGGIIWQAPHHTISAGGFCKLVFGTANMGIKVDNLEIKAHDNTIDHLAFNMNFLISKQAYDLIDNGKLNFFGKAGVGFDAGAEYRYTKDAKGKTPSDYLFKAGFALNDAGFMRYKSGLEYSKINVSADNLSLDRFRGLSSVRAAIDTLSEIFNVDKSPVSTYNVTLPLSFRFYGDYNFKKHLSLYSEFNFTFIRLINHNFKSPVYFQYILTPRYEDKQFGVYLPVMLTNFVPANVGVALRWKPFIIGSSNIFTYWAYKNNGKFFDLYLKVKIPVLYKTERAWYQRKQRKLQSTAPE